AGNPEFAVKYDPKLEYALAETLTYVKENFIISLTHSKKFDSLYFYSNLDLQSIYDGKPIALGGDAFFQIGYHEKIFFPTLAKAGLELERTKVYWLDWSDKTIAYQK